MFIFLLTFFELYMEASTRKYVQLDLASTWMGS